MQLLGTGGYIIPPKPPGVLTYYVVYYGYNILLCKARV